MKVSQAMHELSNDTEIEVVRANHKVDSMCEKWGDKLMVHIDETDRRIDTISQDQNLLSHIDPSDNDIEAIRKQATKFKVQMCKGKSKSKVQPRKGHEVPKRE
jgi:hypothetical protein